MPQRLEYGRAVRLDVAAVVLLTEIADPAVEELQHLRARLGLCGQVRDRQRNELLHAHVKLSPPDPRDAGVADDLSEIVLRAMSKDPELRFQSGADFAAALATVETPAASVRKRGLLRRIAGPS